MNERSVFLLGAWLVGISALAQAPQPTVPGDSTSPAAVSSQSQASPAAAPGSPPIQSGATPVTTPLPAANVTPDYVIGPSDSLSVNVFKEPTMSGTLPVRPDGMISLSLVGDLQAAGLTPMKLSEEIRERLRKFINDPSVTVTVLAVNSKYIFLLGEVGKPGQLPLTPSITPLQAIASVGGLTPYANAKHIYILRTTGGKQLKLPFDYKKAIKTGEQQGVTLTAGDTIVVP